MFFGISIIPDNEILTERQVRKTQCLCGFRDFQNQINLPLYTKFTPIGAENGAEAKKSHNERNKWAVLNRDCPFSKRNVNQNQVSIVSVMKLYYIK